MSSPWNKIEIPEPRNLKDIMDEELNKTLRETKYTTANYPLQDQCSDCYDYREPFCQDCTSGSESDDLEDATDQKFWYKYDTVMSKFDPVPTNTHKHVTYVKKIISVLDKGTNRILNEMMHKGSFDDIKIIARGKQATILYAVKTSSITTSLDTSLPNKFIIKAYKKGQRIGNGEDSYKVKSTVVNKLVHTKVLKEKQYLERIFRAGITCPKVFWEKRNILVMSFIGRIDPAPTLQKANLSLTEAQIAFEQIMQYMKMLYTECNLIHTELNEHHILWVCGACNIVDLSSAVEVWEENAFSFLYDDIRNICKFFAMLKVPNIISPEELFVDITGYSCLDKVTLVELQKSLKRKYYCY